MPRRQPTYAELVRRALGGKAVRAAYEARRRADPALARADRIRRSGRWKKARRLKLARDPLCEDCLEHDVTEAAAQVHHVEPLVRRPDLAFVMENLRSLCTTCHALREAAVRRRPKGG